MKVLFLLSFLFIDSSTNMDTEKTLIKQLKMEEGYRSIPYRDTRNYWTIGYGFNLSGRNLTRTEQARLFPGKEYPVHLQDQLEYWRKNPISQEDSEYLLDRAIHIVESDARLIFGDYFDSIPSQKRVPIYDMLFNLGRTKFLKFKKCIAAIQEANWIEAGKQVRNSLAYLQAKTRYERIAKEFEKE